MPGREEEEERRIERHPGKKGVGPTGWDHRGGEVPETKGLRYHYIREDRLKKLRTPKAQPRTGKWLRPFANKKSRQLLILLANVVLIYAIVLAYFKPSNVYFRQKSREYVFELNVNALRGRKTLVGVTVRNGKDEDLVFQDSVPVSLSIRGRSGAPITFQKYIDRGTVLIPGESTSVVFVFEEDELPRTANLEIFFDDWSDPLFKRNVRF